MSYTSLRTWPGIGLLEAPYSCLILLILFRLPVGVLFFDFYSFLLLLLSVPFYIYFIYMLSFILFYVQRLIKYKNISWSFWVEGLFVRVLLYGCKLSPSFLPQTLTIVFYRRDAWSIMMMMITFCLRPFRSWKRKMD